MVAWEYALLVRRRETGNRLTFVWYGPDGSKRDVSALGDTAIAHLNRVGADGWELVSASEDINNLETAREIYRYHLKRPARSASGHK
jgi:hypothetical protein